MLLILYIYSSLIPFIGLLFNSETFDVFYIVPYIWFHIYKVFYL